MTTTDRRAMRTTCAALVLLAGCGSVRLAPPLDDGERAELAEINGRLAGRTVRVVRARYPGATKEDYVVFALRSAGLTVEDGPAAPADLAVNVDGPFHEDSTFLQRVWGGAWLVSLGVVPFVSDEEREYRCRVVGPHGDDIVSPCVESRAYVGGWLGLPLGLLPGRSPFFGLVAPDHREQAERLGLCLARRIDEFVRRAGR